MRGLLSIAMLSVALFGIGNDLEERDQVVNSVLERVGNIARKESGLKPIGVSFKNDEGKLSIVAQMYQHRGVVDDRESLRLLIFAVNNLLEGINANKEMEKHMVRWPASWRNVEVTIYLDDPEGRTLVDPLPAVVGWSNGEVDIATMETTDAMKFHSKRTMSWEEAMQLAGDA